MFHRPRRFSQVPNSAHVGARVMGWNSILHPFFLFLPSHFLINTSTSTSLDAHLRTREPSLCFHILGEGHIREQGQKTRRRPCSIWNDGARFSRDSTPCKPACGSHETRCCRGWLMAQPTRWRAWRQLSSRNLNHGHAVTGCTAVTPSMESYGASTATSHPGQTSDTSSRHHRSR